MKKIFKLIKKFIAILLLIVIVLVSYIIIDGYNLYKKAINNTSITKMINILQNSDNYVTIDQIPNTYLKAVVAVENKRFYEIGAVDFISLGRAIITNLNTKSLTEGGSTITQQLAKNLYFTQEKKFTRKIAELFVAIDLEKKLNSKDKILELYVNKIYYGDSYTGIYDASIGYFGKHPSNLTLYEQTLLAGLPNAPSVYALSNNSILSYQRQNQVVSAMAEQNYITDEEANKIYETNKYIFNKH